MRFRGKLCYIMGFASGVLFGVVAFDILPEVFEMVSKGIVGVMTPMIALVVGFLGFHVVEKVILVHGSHESHYVQHHHPDVGVMSGLSLVGHSLMDGVSIGLGFQVSQAVGMSVAVAIVSHDFCDGMNTAALMVTHGNSMKRSMAMVLLDSAAPVVGVASTMFFTMPEPFLAGYLGAFAGFLLYVGAADVLPEAHSNSTPKGSAVITLLTCLGALAAYLIVRAIG